jgi:hypothetical protein
MVLLTRRPKPSYWKLADTSPLMATNWFRAFQV